MSLEIYTVLRDFVLTATPTMLIAGVIFIVCILIWIILRPLNYWYWKVDQRDRMLEDMDKKISEIRYIQIKSREAAGNKNHIASKQCLETRERSEAIKAEPKKRSGDNEQFELANPIPDKGEPQTILANDLAGTEIRLHDCTEPTKAATRPGKFSTVADVIDKKGIIHTREEIEQNIRF